MWRGSAPRGRLFYPSPRNRGRPNRVALCCVLVPDPIVRPPLPAKYHRSSMAEQAVNESSGPGRRDARILVVEDEPSIAGFVRRGLHFEGYRVEVVENGIAALRALRDSPPDLLVLDVMVPGVDGFEIARRLRSAEAAERSPALPILMLTARDSVPDRVSGLRAGADDYLVKPFDFDELLARIEALLRRTAATKNAPATRERLNYADLALDLTGRTVRRGDRSIQLTAREFDLLSLFLRHPDQVLPRAMIMDRIWGEDFFGDSNVLEVVIGNLRRALESGSECRLIQTVRGVGYVLRVESSS
jgi:two-component system response regulator MprA